MKEIDLQMLYYNGIYADPDLEQWFVERFKKETGKKPDMGRSCIRFRKEGRSPSVFWRTFLKG